MRVKMGEATINDPYFPVGTVWEVKPMHDKQGEVFAYKVAKHFDWNLVGALLWAHEVKPIHWLRFKLKE